MILRPEAQADGSFKLIAEGSRFGDPGFYRIVSTGPNRWSVRYLPRLHENFHVYVAPDGTLRTEHNIRIAGVRTLTLHYKMPLARSVTASV